MDTPQQPPEGFPQRPSPPESTPTGASPSLESLQHQLNVLQTRLKDQGLKATMEATLWRENYFELRKLFLGTLIALLVLLPALCWFLGKQMRVVRFQLNEQRPKIIRSLNQFHSQAEPRVMQFTSQLQNYAVTHPDFRPVLDPYRRALAQYFTTIEPALPDPPRLPSDP